MLVRFPDGTIKYGAYQNTSDVPCSGLSDHLDDHPRALYRISEIVEPVAPEGEEVDVQIYCTYGGGFHWPGKAQGNYLTDSGWRYDERKGEWIEGQEGGEPDWLPEDWKGV